MKPFMEPSPEQMLEMAQMACALLERGFTEEANEMLDLFLLGSRCPATTRQPSISDKWLLSLFSLRKYGEVIAGVEGVLDDVCVSIGVNAYIQLLRQTRVLGSAEEDELSGRDAVEGVLGAFRTYLNWVGSQVNQLDDQQLDAVTLYAVGLGYEQVENVEAAEKYFQLAVGKSDFMFPARVKLGLGVIPSDTLGKTYWMGKYVLAVSGKVPVQARIGACNKILESDQRNPVTLGKRRIQVTLARLYFYNDRVHEASQILKTLEYSKDASGAEMYATILFKTKDGPNLGKVVADVNGCDRLSVVALFVTALVLLHNSKRESAVINLMKVVKINPQFNDAWLLLAQTYVELRNLPAAVEAYGRVADTDKRAWKGLAQVYELLGQKTFAEYYKSRA